MIRLIAVAFLAVQIAPASAQVPATPRGAGSTATNCTPTRTLPNADGVATRGNEPLGDNLARSDGVLCPPSDVTSDMPVERPDAGAARMPVIPPPGSPGGDPSVRPK